MEVQLPFNSIFATTPKTLSYISPSRMTELWLRELSEYIATPRPSAVP